MGKCTLLMSKELELLVNGIGLANKNTQLISLHKYRVLSSPLLHVHLIEAVVLVHAPQINERLHRVE